jgi:hypothetical protein
MSVLAPPAGPSRASIRPWPRGSEQAVRPDDGHLLWQGASEIQPGRLSWNRLNSGTAGSGFSVPFRRTKHRSQSTIARAAGTGGEATAQTRQRRPHPRLAARKASISAVVRNLTKRRWSNAQSCVAASYRST